VLALCANALVEAKRSEAGAILQRLDGMKRAEGELVWWTSSGEGVTFSRGNCLDIETTALAAYASLKAGRRVDVAHKALAWLVEQKDPQGTWHSTQATVLAMKALLAGTGSSSSIESTLNVTITANGKAVKEIVVTPETSDVFRLVSLRAQVMKGQNIVALEVSGKGALAYQIVATHYLPWPAGEVEPLKPMTIDLKYNTTMLKKDDILSCEVTIRNNSPEAASMTIVDLGVPPGFEVLPDAFNALKKQKVIEQWSMTGRQIILYFRSVPARKPITFTYRMRAKFPVKAKTPRSVIYKYYEPEVRDEAAPVLLTVL